MSKKVKIVLLAVTVRGKVLKWRKMSVSLRLLICSSTNAAVEEQRFSAHIVNGSVHCQLAFSGCFWCNYEKFGWQVEKPSRQLNWMNGWMDGYGREVREVRVFSTSKFSKLMDKFSTLNKCTTKCLKVIFCFIEQFIFVK